MERQMKIDALQEIAIHDCLVQIRSVRIDLPGAEGWIGSWEVYLLPWHSRKRPLHAGETDVESRESMAVGMARAIATAVAVSL
jgi:hypothetical protein